MCAACDADMAEVREARAVENEATVEYLNTLNTRLQREVAELKRAHDARVATDVKMLAALERLLKHLLENVEFYGDVTETAALIRAVIDEYKGGK